jgi:hypothetical protein
MLSQPNTAVLQQAAKLFTKTTAFEKTDRLLEQKLTARQFH